MRNRSAISSRARVLVVAGLAIVGLGVATLELRGEERQGSQQTVWTPVDGKTPVEGEYKPYTSLAPMVKKLEPTVVNIYTTQEIEAPKMPSMPRGMVPGPHGFRGGQDPFGEFFRHFGPPQGNDGPLEGQSLGSGFILSADGYVVTNNHVVDHATEVKVKLSTGEELEAQVVGTDPSTDIALLKLDAGQDLPHVYLADSDELQVGDWVVAIGNPFGLSHTVTAGIVSAKQRVIGAGPYDELIQTDASINPGNSGGPLFDMRGAVVGMNTAIIRNASGIGFAVPVNQLKEVVDQLAQSGHVTRGWLGVGIQALTPELARGMGISSDKGALVTQVFPSSPADKAGVKAGDVVVAFNGERVDDSMGLTKAVGRASPDSPAVLSVLRDGKKRDITVRLGTRNEEQVSGLSGKPSGKAERPETSERLGLRVGPVPPQIRGSDTGDRGVMVEAVSPHGSAARAGVQPGDVVLQVNRKDVTTPRDFEAAVKAIPANREVVLLLNRGNSNLFVALEPAKKGK